MIEGESCLIGCYGQHASFMGDSLRASKGQSEPVRVKGEKDGSGRGCRYGSVRQSRLINLILHTGGALHKSQSTNRYST